MSNLEDELAQEYLVDSREHLATMETEVLAIKMAGAANQDERLGRIFQAARSIGGPAVYFNLVKVRAIATLVERLVDQIRLRSLPVTAGQVQVLLNATDTLQDLIAVPSASNEADTAVVEAELARLLGDCPAVNEPPSKNGVHLDLEEHHQASAAPALQSRGQLRILLAEDDFACRLLLQTFLSRYGECHVAVNGREAVEAFRLAIESGRGYDLICMDIMMPEMDGREAVRQVRSLELSQGIQSTFGAKIFMTTTVQEIKDVFLCFKELCDAYLMKPIDLGELLNQMRHFELLK
jgi:two-component system chemotaxis response regulator CheY